MSSADGFGNEPVADHHRAVFVISVAAELTGCHPQTLRIYERKGLVVPRRADGGGRRYSAADISYLKRIQGLTAEGLTLEGVKRVLALEAQVARLQAQLESVQVAAEEAVRDAHREHRRDLVPLNQEVTLYQRRRR